jgi:hypothetical protein
VNVNPEAASMEIERERRAAIRSLRAVIAEAETHVAELEQPIDIRSSHTGSSLVARELQQIGIAAAAALRHDALLRVTRGEYTTEGEEGPSNGS